MGNTRATQTISVLVMRLEPIYPYVFDIDPEIEPLIGKTVILRLGIGTRDLSERFLMGVHEETYPWPTKRSMFDGTPM